MVHIPYILFTDLYFLVLWLGDEASEKLYDVLPARNVAPVDVDILNLHPGMKAQAFFKDSI